MPSTTNIVQLRQLLAERFPGLRPFSEQPLFKTACWPTGLAAIDHLLHGGLPKSAISELVSIRFSSGSALIVAALLRQTCQTRQWLGLVDGQDCFDPAPLDNTLLSRLLWIRCRETKQAFQAADLLLRDGNLPLVVFDLRLNPAAELRRIPTTTWYRLQRIVELTSTTLLVLTPHPMVKSAHVRLSLESRFTLEALMATEEDLWSRLKIELVQRRSVAGQPQETEWIAEAG
jgi:hypothetical protein